jgi:hypothetical protein
MTDVSVAVHGSAASSAPVRRAGVAGVATLADRSAPESTLVGPPGDPTTALTPDTASPMPVTRRR